MKPIGFILLVAGLYVMDVSYLGGRNTAAVLNSFRAMAKIINHYADDLLRPLNG